MVTTRSTKSVRVVISAGLIGSSDETWPFPGALGIIKEKKHNCRGGPRKGQ